MISSVLIVSLTLLSVAAALCAYRLVQGPSAPDRILAVDTIGINMIGIIAVLSILLGTNYFEDLILVIGILTFIGTTALARYTERREVLERGDDSNSD